MKLIRVLLALLLATQPVLAQGPGQLPAGTMWGNSTGARAPAAPTTVTGIIDRALGSTRGSIITRQSGGWAILAPGTTALPLVSAGAGADPLYSILSIAGGGSGSATAAGARTNFGLGTMATQNANAVAITGGTITGLGTPSVASEAAPKSYVDSLATGIRVLAQSALATAAALPNTPTYANGASGVGATLTAGANSTLTVDGTVAALNTVVLVKDQASAFQNGIYTVTTAGSGAAPWVLTRATYFDVAAEMLAGSYTYITGGATNINKSFALQTTVATVGTDSATFNLFSASGVASVGGVTGAITLSAELAMSGSTLGLAQPTRAASVHLDNTPQTWTPPSPNKYHLFIPIGIKFNQATLFAAVPATIAGWVPPSPAKLMHLTAQFWFTSGVASPAGVTVKWIKNATVDGSFNQVAASGTEVCAGIGAQSTNGAGTAVVNASCYDVPTFGDYYNVFMYVDTAVLGATVVTLDGNPAHTWAQAAVVY